MKLRNQLFMVFSVLFFAVLIAILLVSVASTRHYLEQQLASHAQDAATTLSVTLGQSLGKGDPVLAETQVASVFDRGYFKRIDVLAPDHRAIVTRELPEKIEGVPDWFVKMVPIHTKGGEAFVGSGWRQLGKVLVVSQPTLAYQHLWNAASKLVAWLLAICAAALVLMLALLDLILKPLRAIEKMAVDVQAKRFGQIAHLPGAPELARVVSAMNQMSYRVAEMLDAETARAQGLHQQAYQDGMTGLANRHGLELRLLELLQGEYQFFLGAVVSVKLDDMRLLNREHGFAAIERIMRMVADTARAVFAESPAALLARSNKFSFSFVVVDLTHSQVAELAAELRRRLMEKWDGDAAAQIVAINIGAAFFHQHEDRSAVFARADLAVESARHSARNGLVVLTDKPDEHSSLGSFAWRTLIQTALLENRWRLLRLPVLRLGAPHSVLQDECLARLVDTHAALVPAADFIPMAARHRLMPEVDRAIVTLALAYIKQSPHEQQTVALNLSPQSLSDADFMDWFAGQLAALKKGAKRLAIEVSEFGVVRNRPAALQVRDLVRQHGGEFGIDHFGLDPQAVMLLREMLPDYVKLNGSLTADIAAGKTTNAMLQSFVKLAHGLDVMVIAQHVESRDQVAVLTAAGVDAASGLFFGAPQ